MGDSCLVRLCATLMCGKCVLEVLCKCSAVACSLQVRHDVCGRFACFQNFFIGCGQAARLSARDIGGCMTLLGPPNSSKRENPYGTLSLFSWRYCIQCRFPQ
ncbi:unnamed protein product, partial [Laminaria digitata]